MIILQLTHRFYAKKIINSIIKDADVLNEFPTMGRMVPEVMNKTIREIIKSPYRIIYEIFNNNIEIVAVIHGKQDFNEAFQYQKE